ncbi:MAG: AbrB/MazE/SpoVT family DNA-binding domain-containing protein [Rhizomicrobium sp.]
MQIAKWGNSLAVRLPKALVEKLGLKEGDRVENLGRRQEGAGRGARRAAQAGGGAESAASMQWEIPADYKFSREEAHERGWRLDDPNERR